MPMISEARKVEIRLFGEVELRVAGHVLDVGTPRQQAVLAALIVDAGRPVAIEALVDRVWEESPPVEARNVLYSHLSRIRQLLVRAADLTGEPVVRIERRHAGYVLGVDPELVDLHRFCRLVEHGCGPQCSDVDRVKVLAEALELWRGPPLAAVAGQWAAQVRSSWHRRRLDAVMQWAQAALRLENPAAVITVLLDFVAEYPLVEPLENLLMRALHASGRCAEAIDRYAVLRQRFAADLGADPGPELRALHEAILRGEQPLPSPGPAVRPGRPPATPVQFPPDLHGVTGDDREPRHLEGVTDTFVSPHVDPLADFFGRDSELAAMRTTFTGTAARGAPKTVVLTGMGGVGKTSLARAHARHHRADYGVVWWIRAEETATIDGDFRTLLEILAPHDAGQISDAVAAVHALLADQPRRWLLILDNVPDASSARGLVPAAGDGHVLITSQATVHWPSGQTVMAVEPLTQEASIDLLTSLSSDGDRGAAQLLAQELGGVPLALAQAGAFTRASAVTLATYLRLYRSRRTELHQEGRPPDYPHTVATTWQLAFDRLTPTARALLNVVCFYAPDAIPVHLLFTSANRDESTLSDAVEPLRVLLDDELARHRAVGELLAYSLMAPVRAATMTISMHRLVQAVTRDQLRTQSTTREWVKVAHVLLSAAFPTEPFTAITMATRYHQAHDHFAELLLVQQRVLGTEHPDSLATHDSLARWTGYAGDTAGARDLYTELHQVQRRVLGAEHPDALATLYYVSLFTGQAGDCSRARDLCADLVAVQQRVLGAEHPDTLYTRSRLAYWTGQAGDAIGARDLATELLTVQQRVLGAEHLDTIVGRYNTAFWTGKAENPTALHDVYPYLRSMQEQVMDAEHPDTVTVRHDIPYWPGQEFDIAITRAMFSDLLPAAKRTLGAEHPDTLSCHHNLARWTGYLGDPAGARDLYTELLTIKERVLGAEHPDTLTTRHNLAYWTGLTGAAAAAREHNAQLLAVRERVLGTEHPHTLTTRHNLAHWTAQAGDAGGACDLFAALLPVRERVLGAEHPDTLTTRHHLAHWTAQAAASDG
jgi:DNA-binding SARP family transcriptional activator